MLKKGLTLSFIVLTSLVLASCRSDLEEYQAVFNNDYMDTLIVVKFVAESEREAETIRDGIESIYAEHHTLSTKYEPLPQDSEYLENIYTINEQPKETLEIDKPLYDMLDQARYVEEITDGYFDISMGRIVDAWKEVVSDELSGYTFAEIPEDVYEDLVETVDEIPVVEDAYELSEDDGRYYVRINSEDVELDLGALSKGYATERVNEYLQSRDMRYFSISSGSSSISLGQKFESDDDQGLFSVGLANPMKTFYDWDPELSRTYGRIYVRDASVTTSGNYEQFAVYDGLRYHHIISPKTKRPEHYYHTVTLIGPDAGLLDAISTGLFSMSPDDFDDWMDEHAEAFELEAIRFDYDESIVTDYLENTEFEE
ncbi:MAG: FAD:protein FMN transferase [Acholeplasmataceae bacterium]